MTKTVDWRPEFTAGQLIQMGKFKQAIPVFHKEVKLALRHGVISENELFHEEGLLVRFSNILLNPSNFDEVQKLGKDMLFVEMRIPGFLRQVSKEEFYKNVKLNYETIEPKD